MSLLTQVINQISKDHPEFDRADILVTIHSRIHRSSPWQFAKEHNVLVDNSAEEFMIEFMTTYNSEISPNTY